MCVEALQLLLRFGRVETQVGTGRAGENRGQV